MDISLLIGIFGMLCILIAFYFNEFHKSWNRETVRYNILNIVGSGMLVYYAYTLISLPFMILNGVWFLVAVYKLWLIKK